jgi:hypothetical protein
MSSGVVRRSCIPLTATTVPERRTTSKSVMSSQRLAASGGGLLDELGRAHRCGVGQGLLRSASALLPRCRRQRRRHHCLARLTVLAAACWLHRGSNERLGRDLFSTMVERSGEKHADRGEPTRWLQKTFGLAAGSVESTTVTMASWPVLVRRSWRRSSCPGRGGRPGCSAVSSTGSGSGMTCCRWRRRILCPAGRGRAGRFRSARRRRVGTRFRPRG